MNARILATMTLCAALGAQTLTVPPGADLAEQASVSVNPFASSGLPGTGVPNRMQVVYDAANFTGVTTPILITRMRFRSNGVAASWAGGTIGNMVVDMSTAAADYLGMVNTFDNNHGGDRQTVWNNAVPILPGTSTAATNPNPPGGAFFVDLDLGTNGTPFAWNPALGDLCIDFMSSGFNGTIAGGVPNCDALATGALARRSFTNVGQFTASGTTPSASAIVIEFTYAPITGIHASFNATPRVGGSPLLVNFTDLSSSGAGPVSQAWDFTNDGIDDAFGPTASFNYPCGSHTVKLTITDGVNAPVVLIRNNHIITDQITASFTWSVPATGTVQFTDTSTPAADAWAWDFDGDTIIDSTQQNPQFTYGDCQPRNVTLTASRLCGPGASVTNRVVSALDLTTTFAGGSSGATNWANLFDLTVTNPLGVELCGLDLRTNVGVGTAFNVDIYVCPTTVVGNESLPGVWRRVAQASGVSGGNTSPNQVRSWVPLSNGIYLAPGSYGVMVHHVSGAGQTYTSSGTSTFSNADLGFSNPRVRAGLFSGTLFTPRIWNGTFYYATCNTSGEASYGIFDLGCAGSMGVARNNGGNQPRLGQTLTADFTNLPNDAAFVLLGFSRTTSAFGPLPLDLTSFGAAGCSGRVSPDSVNLITGTGNVATFSLGIPNIPGLLCGQFYTQALVLDAGFNTLNATVSDAAAGVIGN